MPAAPLYRGAERAAPTFESQAACDLLSPLDRSRYSTAGLKAMQLSPSESETTLLNSTAPPASDRRTELEDDLTNGPSTPSTTVQPDSDFAASTAVGLEGSPPVIFVDRQSTKDRSTQVESDSIKQAEATDRVNDCSGSFLASDVIDGCDNGPPVPEISTLGQVWNKLGRISRPSSPASQRSNASEKATGLLESPTPKLATTIARRLSGNALLTSFSQAGTALSEGLKLTRMPPPENVGGVQDWQLGPVTQR